MLGWLIVVPPVVTLIHELGHAIGALALGRRVDMLAVGHHEDVTVTIGSTVLRFGRSLAGKPSGFITLDPEASSDEVIAIALLGPLANLMAAPLLASLARSDATGGLLDTLLWQISVVSVIVGIANLVPRGHYGGDLSDGRLIQIAWAVHRGRPLPVLPQPTDPGPAPRTRWPFLMVLGIVFVGALAIGATVPALGILVLFGFVAVTGGLRTRAF